MSYRHERYCLGRIDLGVPKSMTHDGRGDTFVPQTSPCPAFQDLGTRPPLLLLNKASLVQVPH